MRTPVLFLSIRLLITRLFELIFGCLDQKPTKPKFNLKTSCQSIQMSCEQRNFAPFYNRYEIMKRTEMFFRLRKPHFLVYEWSLSIATDTLIENKKIYLRKPNIRKSNRKTLSLLFLYLYVQWQLIESFDATLFRNSLTSGSLIRFCEIIWIRFRSLGELTVIVQRMAAVFVLMLYSIPTDSLEFNVEER